MRIYTYAISAIACFTLVGCSEEESYEYPDYSYPDSEYIYSDGSSDPYFDEDESTEEGFVEETGDEDTTTTDAESSDTSSEYQSSTSSSGPVSFEAALSEFRSQTAQYQSLSATYLSNLMETFGNGSAGFRLADGVPMTFEEYRDKIREYTSIVRSFTYRYESRIGYSNGSQLRQIASNMEWNVNSELQAWDQPDAISLSRTQVEASRFAFLLDTSLPIPELIELPDQMESNTLIAFYLILAENVRLHANSSELLEGAGPEVLARTKQVLENIHQQLSK